MLMLMLGFYSVKAQIGTNQNVENTLSNSNFFMDASKFNNYANNIGKGLGFPRVDLTKFKFDLSVINNVQILSDFDGMMVYNYGAGNTMVNEGKAVSVTPGFYYFSNPGSPGNINNGKWMRFINDIKPLISDLKIPSNVLYVTRTGSSIKPGNNIASPLWFEATEHINNEYITQNNYETFIINKTGLYTFDLWAKFSGIPAGNDIDKGIAIALSAGSKHLQRHGSRWIGGNGDSFISTTLKLNAGDTFKVATLTAKNGTYTQSPGAYLSVMYTAIP